MYSMQPHGNCTQINRFLVKFQDGGKEGGREVKKWEVGKYPVDIHTLNTVYSVRQSVTCVHLYHANLHVAYGA